MRILGIAGSLRAGSFNRQLLRQAAALLPSEVGWQEWDGLPGVPPFNADEEADPPATVRALWTSITAADAVLLTTPEYNGSIPGLLKNAVDWASRPADEGVLIGKPVAVVGCSPSAYGASSAQAELRKVCARAGARVLDRELPVTRAHQAFGTSGRLLDPALVDRLRHVLAELVAMPDRSSTALVC